LPALAGIAAPLLIVRMGPECVRHGAHRSAAGRPGTRRSPPQLRAVDQPDIELRKLRGVIETTLRKTFEKWL
jgi:hypothetical protein